MKNRHLFRLLLSISIALISMSFASAAEQKVPVREQTTVVNEDSVYLMVDEQPSFPGGEAMLMKYISKNLRYPESAISNNVGRLTISFIVEKDSTLSHIEIIHCKDKNLSREGIRLIESMPKWEPGKKDGKIVRVKYVIPINIHPQ